MDEYGVTDSDAVYAAFATFTETGLTIEQLVLAARMVKTIINIFEPGTLVDDVPEVEISV